MKLEDFEPIRFVSFCENHKQITELEFYAKTGVNPRTSDDWTFDGFLDVGEFSGFVCRER